MKERQAFLHRKEDISCLYALPSYLAGKHLEGSRGKVPAYCMVRAHLCAGNESLEYTSPMLLSFPNKSHFIWSQVLLLV